VLIIYLRVIRFVSENSLELLNKYIFSKNHSKNISFLRKIYKQIDTNNNHSIYLEIIPLIKLLEFYFFEQYNKNLEQISQTLNRLNISDYINANLFLFESVYDIVQVSYKSFKEKVYWNFGEIINTAYHNYPKMIKKTLYRHINYLPLQESLLYNIIQYYYSNKEFRKCKILIRVKFT
jgi:hypothetical protein